MKKFDKSYYLNQIPVFALRKQLYELTADRETRKAVADRLRQTLRRSSVRDPETTIRNMVRDDLVRLIKKCPEIDDDVILELFEEYRYGANPSFFIYLFNSKFMGRHAIEEIRPHFKKSIEEYNRSVPKELPRVRKLVSDGLVPLSEDGSVIEGTYHFQRRMDLIDEKENPTSIYATVYGFFWINIKEGYAVIQGHDRSILHALENAISEGADLHLVSLTITKELKNALPFLLNEAICSSKLHDPNPKSRRFKWLSITDERLYNKGYKNLETKYPEVSSARYKVEIGDIRDRTLSIGFDQGEMSIAGKLTATQFRAWALNCLSEIIQKIRDFENEPSKYVTTRKFIAVKELRKYPHAQKEHIIKLLAMLLDLKKNPGIGSRTLDISPLELARDMKNLVYVQFVIPCDTDACSREGYLTCPNCGGGFFHVLEADGKWTLQCAVESRRSWSAPLPIDIKCEMEHPMHITAHDLERWIEILPNMELMDAISDMIGKYIPDAGFQAGIEYFMIRGWNMKYYDDSGDLSSFEYRTQTIITNIHTGNVENSNIVLGNGNQALIQSTPVPDQKKKKKQINQPVMEAAE